MASDVNVFVISGRIVKDAEYSVTRTGKELLRFSVAVNNFYRQNGMGMTSVSFIPCSCFGKQATALSDMLKKGLQVTVMGKIVQSRYTDKSGNSKIAYNFNVVSVKCAFPPKDIEQTEEEVQEEVKEEEELW